MNKQPNQYPPGSVGRYALERGWVRLEDGAPPAEDDPAATGSPSTGPASAEPVADQSDEQQPPSAERAPTEPEPAPGSRHARPAAHAQPPAPDQQTAAQESPTPHSRAEQAPAPQSPPEQSSGQEPTGQAQGTLQQPPSPKASSPSTPYVEEPVTHPELDLSSARLLRPVKRVPQTGWRRLLYLASGRLINPGESPVDTRRRELTQRLQRPLNGCFKIAMLSLKGGVGKTTVTATLGSTFASLRGDRVVAVDANPDRGTLSQKIPLETTATVRHLLRDAARVRRYTDVRAYTSQGLSRLEVLASEQDPAVSEAFSEDDYRRTVNLLEHFYNIVLTDCGTGLMHSAMYGVLGVADQLIIVSSGSIDGARSASATMDWLDAHGHGELVKSSVAVINSVRRSAGGVDIDRVAEHFAARCRAVVRVPFDSHLDEGAEIDLDRLASSTRMALLELAANVADAF